MADDKEADGILYRHFTIMNQELEHLRGLITELESKVKRLQSGVESLEDKTLNEDSRLQREIEKSSSEMANLDSELRKNHETLAGNVTELGSRLAERSQELTQLKVGFEKELAPFTWPSEKPEPDIIPANESTLEKAREKFIDDMQATEDSKVEEIAETVDSEDERKKRKRK